MKKALEGIVVMELWKLYLVIGLVFFIVQSLKYRQWMQLPPPRMAFVFVYSAVVWGVLWPLLLVFKYLALRGRIQAPRDLGR